MYEIDHRKVAVTGGYWKSMLDLISDVTIDAVYDRFESTGRIAAFDCRYREGGDLPRPHPFWDSDVAKWIEAASYIIASGKREDLIPKIERIVDAVVANQWDDGYINSYYTAVAPEKRFTVRMDHELYCCGHLIEAAVAYHEATGRDRFLNAVRRCADLIDRVFRVENSASFATPRHPEIELALFRLFRATGDEKYKTLAEHFIAVRGREEKDINGATLRARRKVQDLPFEGINEAFGHCVCAGYYYTALADMALLNGDGAQLARCRAIFDDVTEKKMYLTGGVGSTYHGEAFTIPYDLPPDGAYTETCASAGMIFFAQRMLRAEHDGAYADVIERELYNGLASGLSLDGKNFFYENPLEIDLASRKRITCTDEYEHFPPAERKEMFDCACCPPNVCRVFASIADRLYSGSGSEISVDQYASSVCDTGKARVEISTGYPSDGVIRVRQEGVTRLYLRVPGWCEKYTLDAPHRLINGYAVVNSPARELTLTLDMEPRAVFANPLVRAVSGRAALTRGPVVYCLESRDNGGIPPYLFRLSLPLEALTSFDPSLGAETVTAKGERLVPAEKLYLSEKPQSLPAELKFIPYRAFANRGADDMAVWIGVSG